MKRPFLLTSQARNDLQEIHFAGSDLRNVPPNILAILTNREAIAIDQDPLGRQGRRAWHSGDQEIRVRELAAGNRGR